MDVASPARSPWRNLEALAAVTLSAGLGLPLLVLVGLDGWPVQGSEPGSQAQQVRRPVALPLPVEVVIRHGWASSPADSAAGTRPPPGHPAGVKEVESSTVPEASRWCICQFKQANQSPARVCHQPPLGTQEGT